jgi:hypothetical protein
MARVIRLDQVGTYVEQQMEKLLRSAVLETDALLKSASPVDLPADFGLAGPLGENAAPFQGMPPGDYRGQPSAGHRVAWDTAKSVLVTFTACITTCHMHEKLAIGATSGSGVNEREKPYNPSSYGKELGITWRR